jgi:undecaprenyl phosphate N,N'-diacetylbacillosamine 1-phosphate transferase
MIVQNAFKRIMDICLSAIGLLIASPAIVIIAIAIKMTSPGPTFFIQDRVGKDGRVFRMYKFRSMYHGAERSTLGKYISVSDSSITPLGRMLRRWALDELPQLLNVLKGDMSIVGPRPTLGYQVEKYDSFQRKRLDVKPGITGWAQVNGRNKISWPERIELDVWYAESWSIGLDVRIMLTTISALLKKEFAFAADDAVDDEIVRIEGRDGV